MVLCCLIVSSGSGSRGRRRRGTGSGVGSGDDSRDVTGVGWGVGGIGVDSRDDVADDGSGYSDHQGNVSRGGWEDSAENADEDSAFTGGEGSSLMLDPAGILLRGRGGEVSSFILEDALVRTAEELARSFLVLVFRTILQ
jgi:hypothetical protein